MSEADNEIDDFLRESNAIEGVYDDGSLKQARRAWNNLLKYDQLTEGALLKTHKILMLNQPLTPDAKGYFRRVPVFIGGREGLEVSLIAQSIKQWLLNANDIIVNGKNEDRGFLERMIKKHHVVYELIHPFVDGNGRTGRIFMNWQRIRLGFPILVIRAGEEQQEYYKWFK